MSSIYQVKRPEPLPVDSIAVYITDDTCMDALVHEDFGGSLRRIAAIARGNEPLDCKTRHFGGIKAQIIGRDTASKKKAT
jgi:hypothetical protein